MGRKSHDDEHALRLKAVMSARLRAARLARGLTQKAVAQEVGVKVRFISSLENGDAFPSHRREGEAWRRLLTVLLDPNIHPASILDALYTGIIHHLVRGVDQGTIDVSRIETTHLCLGVKYPNCHETVLLRAFRLLKIGY